MYPYRVYVRSTHTDTHDPLIPHYYSTNEICNVDVDPPIPIDRICTPRTCADTHSTLVKYCQRYTYSMCSGWDGGDMSCAFYSRSSHMCCYVYCAWKVVYNFFWVYMPFSLRLWGSINFFYTLFVLRIDEVYKVSCSLLIVYMYP